MSVEFKPESAVNPAEQESILSVYQQNCLVSYNQLDLCMYSAWQHVGVTEWLKPEQVMLH